MFLASFMQKIIFTVKKIHKNCCKQNCSFWLRYQPNHSAAGALPQPQTGGAYSTPRDPLAVFMGPTSKGRKRGEGRERKKKKGEQGRLSR